MPWAHVIDDLNGEEIVGTFYKKELQKKIKKSLELKKKSRKKINKLYVKWKRYNNLFNSWKDKKEHSINE